MLIVILPVFVMVIWFSLRYRASKAADDYAPTWSGSARIERIIWLVPVAIVIVLSYLAWTKTFQLDPYKPIEHHADPLRIQVISMDWNWLFIYPNQQIASLNRLIVPADVPLAFELTSASVMTSFFIPQLGSQMYAMAGMRTQLHLLADTPGIYKGYNMEFSGQGYATMHFNVEALDQTLFDRWLKQAAHNGTPLDTPAFDRLAEPHIGHEPTLYAPVSPGLFDKTIQRYMGWMNEMNASTHMQSHTQGVKP